MALPSNVSAKRHIDAHDSRPNAIESSAMERQREHVPATLEAKTRQGMSAKIIANISSGRSQMEIDSSIPVTACLYALRLFVGQRPRVVCLWSPGDFCGLSLSLFVILDLASLRP
jgi:hypothetical protein